MKVTIEYYRVITITALICFVANFIGFIVPELGSGFTMIPLILCCAFGALVALTNIKNGHIKAYWKKKGIYLTIPFQQGRGKIVAYDDNGNRYKLGILFIPKKCESDEF